jgi:hypothetical protein
VDRACGGMTVIQPDLPVPPGPEPAPSPTPIEDPPIGDPPSEGPQIPIEAMSEDDPDGREDTIAGPGDGTEGPDAPDEPGPRPPGFPDPSGPDEESSGEHF